MPTLGALRGRFTGLTVILIVLALLANAAPPGDLHIARLVGIQSSRSSSS